MKRTGNGAKYGVEYFRTDLANVAEKTKSVPDEYINKTGNGMTKAFAEYAKPLVGCLPQTEFLGTYPTI
jgi:6-phosphofructokinase 1